MWTFLKTLIGFGGSTAASVAAGPVGWLSLLVKYWWVVPILGLVAYAGYEKFELAGKDGQIATAQAAAQTALTARDQALHDRDQAQVDAKAASASALAAQAELAQRAATEAAHAKRVNQLESANAILLNQIRDLPHDVCLDAPLPASVLGVLNHAFGPDAGVPAESPAGNAGSGAAVPGAAPVPAVGR